MNRRFIGAAGAFVLAAFVAGSSSAAMGQGRGRGQGQAKTKAKVEDKKENKKVEDQADRKDKTARSRSPQSLFDSRDRDTINNYYAGLPPGLAKRGGDLPPGLERQLQRNGTLPPGLRKRLQPFPAALERQLAPLPRGYRRGIIDDHMVVYRTDNYSIADFFRR
jgi:hypothetical protein